MAAVPPVITRFSVPEIEDPTLPQYRAWKGQMTANIASIPGLLPIWNVAMTAVAGVFPVAGLVYPGAAAGASMRQSTGVLYAATYGACKGNSLLLVSQQNAQNLTDIVKILDVEYDRNATIDQNITMASFYADKWEETKMELRAFINWKYSLVLQCQLQIPAGPARNAAMNFTLTTHMPPAFDEVTSACRVADLTWQETRDRILDFDRANPKSKREAQQKALLASARGMIKSENAALMARVGDMEQAMLASQYENKSSGGASSSKQDDTGLFAGGAPTKGKFDGECHKCGKWGHSQKFCYSKNVLPTWKQPKNKGKGKNKKGKGKKGGKKGAKKGAGR